MRKLWDDIGIKETRSLMEYLRTLYGDDFRDVALIPFMHRLCRAMMHHGLESIEELHTMLQAQGRALYDEILCDLAGGSLDLFRDPSFWILLRDALLPELLRTNCKLNIWNAALTSPGDLYSLLIVLEEMGIREQTTIWASFMGQAMLQRLQRGHAPYQSSSQDAQNYGRFNPAGDFSNYVLLEGDANRLNAPGIEAVQWLKIGSGCLTLPEGRCHLVLCRNQLMACTPRMAQAWVNRFSQVVHHGGFLALGVGESLEGQGKCCNFTLSNAREALYRRD